MYKWLLDCIVYLFAEPIEESPRSSISSDDEYRSLEDYVKGSYGSSIEHSALEKGVTIAESAPPNYGFQDPIIRAKIFSEELVSVKSEPVSVKEQQTSFWSFFTCCCGDASVVTEEEQNHFPTSKILEELIGKQYDPDSRTF